MEAAIVEKLGPTTRPREKYFARFESYFNALSEDDREAIRTGASDRKEFVADEDEVTREFLEATKTFFANYGDSFQRGDYKEFARLVKVIWSRSQYKLGASKWVIVILLVSTYLSWIFVSTSSGWSPSCSGRRSLASSITLGGWPRPSTC